jgi:hypothetical protein
VAAFQHLALQDVTNGAVTELGTACSNQHNPFLHFILLVILIFDIMAGSHVVDN